MNPRLLFTLCLVAVLASLVPSNAAPTELIEDLDEEEDPIENAVFSVGEKTLLLSEGLSEMIEKASEDEVTSDEVQAMCGMFYEEYKNILRQMEELRRIAEANGTVINIDIDPEDVLEVMTEVMEDLRVSARDLTVIIFDGEGPLSGDDKKIDLFVGMLNELSRMATYEAKYNLIQADGPEDVQGSLDNIISITGAIMEVANGLMETIADEVSQIKEHGGLPPNDDDDDDDDESDEEVLDEGFGEGWDAKENKEIPLKEKSKEKISSENRVNEE